MNARPARIVRTGVLAAAAGVVTMATGAPAYAADGADQNVDVVNTETVQVYTSPAGDVQSRRVYEQLALTGNGKVDLTNPISSDGVRNLDGFWGSDVKGADQVVHTTVDGEKKYRSVSDYERKLPLDVSVAYRLDGKDVKPGDIVGESGHLEVKYTVRNVTGTPRQLTFPDGKGGTVTKTVDVPVPMVGSLSTVAPTGFTDVRSEQANMAGDGEGGTQLSYTMTLFPPIGSTTAEFGYSANIHDGVVPRAEVSAVPVNPLASPTFKSAAGSYKGGADTGVELASGAGKIDANLLKLRDGASTLLAGLIKLRAGADQLNGGLSGVAAPGADKLANGAGDLSAGLGKLDGGAGKLANGAGRLDDGVLQLAQGSASLDLAFNNPNGVDLVKGSAALVSGLTLIQQGLDSLDGQLPQARDGLQQLGAAVDAIVAALGDETNPQSLIGGMKQINDGLGAAKTGATQVQGGAGQLAAGLPAAKAGVDQVRSGLGSAGGKLDALSAAISSAKGTAGCTGDPVCAGTLAQVLSQIPDFKTQLAQASGGLGDVSTGLGTAVAGAGALQSGANQLAGGISSLQGGSGQVLAGLQSMKGQVQGQMVPGVDALVEGLTAAVVGVGQLNAGGTAALNGAQDLHLGIDKTGNGAHRLHNGLGDAKSGSGRVADGADRLADGAGDAADGSDQIAGGADKLADGLGDAADGSGKLHDGLSSAAGGTPKLVHGAQRLSDEGTKKLAEAGTSTAQSYGQLYATMVAGSKRAQHEDMAFGAPKDALGLTAYNYVINGDDGETGRNLARGLAGVALLGAGAGVFALRRRLSLAA